MEENPKTFTYALATATVLDLIFNRLAKHEKNKIEAMLKEVSTYKDSLRPGRHDGALR